MGFESDADRLEYLKGFGELASYTPSGGVLESIYLIYDAPYIDALSGESIAPVATARTDDLTAPVHNGTLVVSAGTFTILNVEPDSEGMTLLILEAV
jgi:hypothetical protein